MAEAIARKEVVVELVLTEEEAHYILKATQNAYIRGDEEEDPSVRNSREAIFMAVKFALDGPQRRRG